VRFVFRVIFAVALVLCVAAKAKQAGWWGSGNHVSQALIDAAARRVGNHKESALRSMRTREREHKPVSLNAGYLLRKSMSPQVSRADVGADPKMASKQRRRARRKKGAEGDLQQAEKTLSQQVNIRGLGEGNKEPACILQSPFSGMGSTDV